VTRILVRALLGTAVAFAATFGLLQIGLARPGSGDRVAARVVAVLDKTYGKRAEITLGSGEPIAVHCTRLRHAVSVVRTAAGEIVASGVHIVVVRELATRVVEALKVPDLAAAELDVAGSHAVYARELGSRLERKSMIVRHARYARRAAYLIVLRPARPRVEIVVSARTLRPVAATYRSADLVARSKLGLEGRGGC
jgi:hypothetical protein